MFLELKALHLHIGAKISLSINSRIRISMLLKDIELLSRNVHRIEPDNLQLTTSLSAAYTY